MARLPAFVVAVGGCHHHRQFRAAPFDLAPQVEPVDPRHVNLSYPIRKRVGPSSGLVVGRQINRNPLCRATKRTVFSHSPSGSDGISVPCYRHHFLAMVRANWAEPVPAALLALNVTLNVPPDPLGVPEIRPVVVLTDSPGGKPVPLKLVGLLLAVIW